MRSVEDNTHVCVAIVLQHGAVCCSVLQCVAVCCSVLQDSLEGSWELLRTRVMCVLHVCCSIVRCVAVCCRVLHDSSEG